jgi:Na+-driven multidrug efflux pump
MEPVKRADQRRRRVVGSGVGAELRATLALAAPLAAADLAQMAMAVTNTVMVGRLGAMPLAAAGLGGMLYFTGGVILQGILFAVAPLTARALGAGDRRPAGRNAGAVVVNGVVYWAPATLALAPLLGPLAAKTNSMPSLPAANKDRANACLVANSGMLEHPRNYWVCVTWVTAPPVVPRRGVTCR